MMSVFTVRLTIHSHVGNQQKRSKPDGLPAKGRPQVGRGIGGFDGCDRDGDSTAFKSFGRVGADLEKRSYLPEFNCPTKGRTRKVPGAGSAES